MNVQISLNAKQLFTLLGGYPNPEGDDSGGGPFGPIIHIARELMSVIAHRPISDPSHWGGRPLTTIWTGPDPSFGKPDPTPWLLGDLRTPWIAWLSALIARDYAVQLLELANLSEQLPEFKDSLLERASVMNDGIFEWCGTLTPSQKLQLILKKKGINFPPKGWPKTPDAFGGIAMANELYQTSLLIGHEGLSEQVGNTATKLLETGLARLG